jgi:hypothetical protein
MALRDVLIDASRFAMAEANRTPEPAELVGPGL